MGYFSTPTVKVTMTAAESYLGSLVNEADLEARQEQHADIGIRGLLWQSEKKKTHLQPAVQTKQLKHMTGSGCHSAFSS